MSRTAAFTQYFEKFLIAQVLVLKSKSLSDFDPGHALLEDQPHIVVHLDDAVGLPLGGLLDALFLLAVGPPDDKAVLGKVHVVRCQGTYLPFSQATS